LLILCAVLIIICVILVVKFVLWFIDREEREESQKMTDLEAVDSEIFRKK